MSLNHDNWLGYLVSIFIDETVTHSKECCPGCKDGKHSPLLHTHHHFGLLEKLYMFHPIVKEKMLSKISTLVSNYVAKFPDPDIYDEAGQKVLRVFGKDFLIQSNAKFLYYSHYLTPELDEMLPALPTNTIHIKPMNMKRVAAKMGKKKQPSKKRSKKGAVMVKNTI